MRAVEMMDIECRTYQVVVNVVDLVNNRVENEALEESAEVQTNLSSEAILQLQNIQN